MPLSMHLTVWMLLPLVQLATIGCYVEPCNKVSQTLSSVQRRLGLVGKKRGKWIEKHRQCNVKCTCTIHWKPDSTVLSSMHGCRASKDFALQANTGKFSGRGITSMTFVCWVILILYEWHVILYLLHAAATIKDTNL